MGDFFAFLAPFFPAYVCVYVQSYLNHVDFSLPINLDFIWGEKNLVCKRFSMWLVRRMVAILDLLSRGAGGEAGCEGSLDK